jgi:hypothetical protein
MIFDDSGPLRWRPLKSLHLGLTSQVAAEMPDHRERLPTGCTGTPWVRQSTSSVEGKWQCLLVDFRFTPIREVLGL